MERPNRSSYAMVSSGHDDTVPSVGTNDSAPKERSTTTTAVTTAPNKDDVAAPSSSSSDDGDEVVDDEEVARAIRFLSHPSIADLTTDEKTDFLRRKGVADQRIVSAARELEQTTTTTTMRQPSHRRHELEDRDDHYRERDSEDVVVSPAVPATLGGLAGVAILAAVRWLNGGDFVLFPPPQRYDDDDEEKEEEEEDIAEIKRDRANDENCEERDEDEETEARSSADEENDDEEEEEAFQGPSSSLTLFEQSSLLSNEIRALTDAVRELRVSRESERARVAGGRLTDSAMDLLRGEQRRGNDDDDDAVSKQSKVSRAAESSELLNAQLAEIRSDVSTVKQLLVIMAGRRKRDDDKEEDDAFEKLVVEKMERLERIMSNVERQFSVPIGTTKVPPTKDDDNGNDNDNDNDNGNDNDNDNDSTNKEPKDESSTCNNENSDSKGNGDQEGEPSTSSSKMSPDAQRLVDNLLRKSAGDAKTTTTTTTTNTNTTTHTTTSTNHNDEDNVSSNKDEPVVDSRVLVRRLRDANRDDPAALVEGVRVLSTYARNLARGPTVPRYRRVYARNATFRNAVAEGGRLKGGIDLLRGLGFEEREDGAVLEWTGASGDVDRVRTASDELSALLRKLEEEERRRRQRQQTNVQPTADRDDGSLSNQDAGKDVAP